MHSIYNALESSQSHPPTPGLWEDCLPQNHSLVPKWSGTAGLEGERKDTLERARDKWQRGTIWTGEKLKGGWKGRASEEEESQAWELREECVYRAAMPNVVSRSIYMRDCRAFAGFINMETLIGTAAQLESSWGWELD